MNLDAKPSQSTGFTMTELLVAMSVVAVISIVIATSMALLSDTYRIATNEAKLLQKKVALSDFLKRHVMQAGSVHPQSLLGEITAPVELSFSNTTGGSNLTLIYDENGSSRVKYNLTMLGCTSSTSCSSNDTNFIQLTKWAWVNSAWQQQGESEPLALDVDAFQVVVENSNGLATSAFPSLTSLFDNDVALISLDILLRSSKALKQKAKVSRYELYRTSLSFEDRYVREHLRLNIAPRVSL